MEDDTKRYSVYVGGTEVNDYYLDLNRATDLADDYELDGYDEIWIRLWTKKELKELKELKESMEEKNGN